MNYVSIPTIFNEITQRVSTRLLTQLKVQNPNITGVHFRCGHHLEIKSILKELDGGVTTPKDKWPMIALFRDFTEQTGIPGIYSRPTMTFVIATVNDLPNMKSDEREQMKFIPILHPIYEAFLLEISLDWRVSVLAKDKIPHTRIDHYFYGSSVGIGDENPGKNIFNEWTDSIEIRDLIININTNC